MWSAQFCIGAPAAQQPRIQNRKQKSIPTYKMSTLTYAFCFWQFDVQV